MTCLVIEQMTYRADGIQSKRRDLWAIEQMVNRANGTRANGHRADVVAPSKTEQVKNFSYIFKCVLS